MGPEPTFRVYVDGKGYVVIRVTTSDPSLVTQWRREYGGNYRAMEDLWELSWTRLSSIKSLCEKLPKTPLYDLVRNYVEAIEPTERHNIAMIIKDFLPVYRSQLVNDVSK
jgi:hypothetical protein